MKHLRVVAVIWLVLGTIGILYYFDSARNDLTNGRSDMVVCFVVALLLVVAACGLFFGKLWSRILIGLLAIVVGWSGLVLLLLMLGRKHYSYAVGPIGLLSMCIYTLFAIFQPRRAE